MKLSKVFPRPMRASEAYYYKLITINKTYKMRHIKVLKEMIDYARKTKTKAAYRTAMSMVTYGAVGVAGQEGRELIRPVIDKMVEEYKKLRR